VTSSDKLNMAAAGIIDISPLISRTFSLDQAEEAFSLAAGKTILKAVFRP
jgi:threonine dehydrogenase-like Zn-dependent dehydrogenase